MARRTPETARDELEVRPVVRPGSAGSDSAAPSRASNRESSTAGRSATTTTGADDSDDRAGTDGRRRGWFWHWNTIVTQYAPLVGLKGIGLLNSYTVWTDRREESPHRGYAFPSQQAEADFYGVDRSELITINKILIALELIEIRKEMLERRDDSGRLWRVPHNLYRVKDRPDGVNLRAEDVIRVAELARDDDSVYRYLRRMFSARFKPIDRDNVWHEILVRVADHPAWIELQERTRVLEQRSSARTRAGHVTRGSSKPKHPEPSADDMTMVMTNGQIKPGVFSGVVHDESTDGRASTFDGVINSGSESQATNVATGNDGSEEVVAGGNNGWSDLEHGTAARVNNGSAGVVASSNTTKDQGFSTTTTTRNMFRDLTGNQTGLAAEDEARASERKQTIRETPQRDREPVHGVNSDESTQQCHATAAPERARTGDRTDSPETTNGDTPPLSRGVTRRVESEVDNSAPAETVTPCHPRDADANVATSLVGQRGEREHAGGRNGERSLADAESGGPLGDPSPLVVSTFEAANDRRTKPLERMLLAELERDADSAARSAGSTGAEWVVAAMREAVASGSSFVAPKRVREIIARWSNDSPPSSTAAPALVAAPRPLNRQAASSATHALPPAPEVRLPGGASGTSIWANVLADLSKLIAPDAFERLLATSAITRYWRGTVEIRLPSADAAAKLSSEYRGLVERRLNSELRRPVSVHFWSEAETDTGGKQQDLHDADTTVSISSGPSIVVTEPDLEIGRQLWQAILTDLSSVIGSGDAERISGGAVLGEDVSGAMLVSVGSAHARRLVERRYRHDVERALSTLLARSVTFRVLDDGEWVVADRTG